MVNKNDSNVESDDVIYKPYTVNEYDNSDGNPMGISIRGKTKEFIAGHDAIKDLLKKGSKHSVLDVKLNVLDVKSLPVMKVAIVEVSKSDKSRGNVELKVYKPSVKKNKGASLEMRILSGYDFEHVRVLRETIEHYLDDYINDDNAKLVDMKVQDTIFRCVKCDWISKSEPALK